MNIEGQSNHSENVFKNISLMENCGHKFHANKTIQIGTNMQQSLVTYKIDINPIQDILLKQC